LIKIIYDLETKPIITSKEEATNKNLIDDLSLEKKGDLYNYVFEINKEEEKTPDIEFDEVSQGKQLAIRAQRDIINEDIRTEEAWREVN